VAGVLNGANVSTGDGAVVACGCVRVRDHAWRPQRRRVRARGLRQQWWSWCDTGRLYVVIHKDCNTSFYHRAAAAELSSAGGGGDGSGGDEGRWWFCVAAVVEAWPLCYSIAAAESVENRMGSAPGCGGG